MSLRIAAVGLLFGLGAFLTLPFIAVGSVTGAPTTTAHTPTNPHIVRCTDDAPDTPHFYFFDRGKESKGSFGPSADKGSDAAVKQELVRRLCGDKYTGQDLALVEVMDRLRAVTVPSAQSFYGDPGSPPNIADDLVREGINWSRSQVVTTTTSEDAVTLFMRKASNKELPPTMVGAKVPRVLVTTLSQAHRHSRFLELYFNGGDTPVFLRLPCGFQPVFTDAHKAAMIAD